MTDTNKTNTLFNAYLTAKANLEEAQKAVDAALVTLKTEVGATFAHQDQLYQVRVRNNSPYIVPLKEHPREWLAASRERILTEARERDGVKKAEESTEDKVINATVEEAADEMPELRVAGSDVVID